MRSFLVYLLLFVSVNVVNAQTSVELNDPQISFNFVSKNVEGTISGFSSSSTIDLDNISTSKFKGSVETETLDSGNFLRNWSLKGSKYFDVDTFPVITFESESISESEDGFSVKGLLTIKGISKSITIAFKKINDRLVGSTALFSSDFDIEIMKKRREDNKVIVKLSFKVD